MATITDFSPGLLEFVKDHLNDEPVMPDYQSLLYDIYEEREEVLLAILAAGVPANCIELTGPCSHFNFRDKHFTLDLGFKFTGNVI